MAANKGFDLNSKLRLGGALVAVILIGLAYYFNVSKKIEEKGGSLSDLQQAELNLELPSESEARAQGAVADYVNDKLRTDFKVQCEFVNHPRDAKGVVTLAANEPLQVVVQPERDCWLGVYYMDGDHKILRLLPTDDQRGFHIKAGEKVTVPDVAEAALKAQASSDVQRIRVIASTEEWEPLEAPRLGRFVRFDTTHAHAVRFYKQMRRIRWGKDNRGDNAPKATKTSSEGSTLATVDTGDSGQATKAAQGEGTDSESPAEPAKPKKLVAEFIFPFKVLGEKPAK